MLAVSAYREFLTLYPQHPRSDYAQFRAAESYFKQKNSPDRDQTSTGQALEEYERLLDVYPQSQLVEQTRERIRECRQTLARSHYQVGYFYQRTRQVLALGDRALRDRSSRSTRTTSRLDEVLFRLGQVPVVLRPLRRGPAALRPAPQRVPREPLHRRKPTSSKPPFPPSRPGGSGRCSHAALPPAQPQV